MPLNSVNNNMTASIALATLNNTATQLQVTQKQISTGYRVSDAVDDGAAYAVAQRVRSDVGALTTANQQLGSVSGLVGTAVSSLNSISNTLNSARDVLVNLSSSSTTGSQRSQYASQYTQLMNQVQSDIEDSKYHGNTLIGNIGGTSGFASVSVVRNEVGSTYGIATFGGSALYGSVNSSGFTAAAGAVAAITATGTFTNMLDEVGTKLNYYGSVTNYLSNQQSFNNNKIDSLNNGLGSLIDANLAQESAQLQSLQIKQQLGTQALSIANQAPQTLLSLFK